MRRYRLRLASTSPRRRALLPLLGFPVTAVSVDVDEQPGLGEHPVDTARRLAAAKAASAGRVAEHEVVVGADTIVVLDGVQLGKPTDSADGHRMLAALRGRPHQVISGVALLGAAGGHLGTVSTSVQMREYSDEELERYVASGRPLDKAGAYAIQDTDFGPVASIEGCYLNVVGLPLCAVSRGLGALGWPVVEDGFDPPCRLCHAGRELLVGR